MCPAHICNVFIAQRGSNSGRQTVQSRVLQAYKLLCNLPVLRSAGTAEGPGGACLAELLHEKCVNLL